MCDPVTAAYAAAGAFGTYKAKQALSSSPGKKPVETMPSTTESTPEQASITERDRARRRARLAFGQQGTMLTGGQGAGLPGSGGTNRLLGS